MTARDLTAALDKARAAVAEMPDAPVAWRVIFTDSESPDGIAPVCTAEPGNLHMITDYPGGPIRNEHGVYDCCPWPHIETYAVPVAAYLVALLNADAAAVAQQQPEPVVTPEVAAHVLWHMHGNGGYPAGSFTAGLLAAWNLADPANSARLAAGFPEYAAAIDLIQQRDGIEQLRRIAEGDTTGGAA
ncbi:hypothetical protein ACWF94_03555 [Streptomyces sp. NPDC055078]